MPQQMGAGRHNTFIGILSTENRENKVHQMFSGSDSHNLKAAKLKVCFTLFWYYCATKKNTEPH